MAGAEGWSVHSGLLSYIASTSTLGMTVTYSFEPVGTAVDKDGESAGSNLTRAWSEAEKTSFRAVVDRFMEVTDLTITEVAPSASADINMQMVNHVPGGWAGYLSTNYNIVVGSADESLLTHEFGHALGLAHPFDDGFGTKILPGINIYDDVEDPYETDTYGVNSNYYTVMAYQYGELAGYPGFNTALPTSLAVLDIAALQAMYGANEHHRTGNDTYGVTNTAQTIWDAGGVDAIDFSSVSIPTVIDLRPVSLEASWGSIRKASVTSRSEASENVGSYLIAYGVDIENAFGGASDDKITGNRLSNELRGGDGNDYISYGDEFADLRAGDLIYGENGNDDVYAGGGDDSIYGGAGNDSLKANDGADLVYGGSGNDTLIGGYGDDSIYGGAGDDSIDAGHGIDSVYGGIGEDTLHVDWTVHENWDTTAAPGGLRLAYSRYDRGSRNIFVSEDVEYISFKRGYTVVLTYSELARRITDAPPVIGTEVAEVVDGTAASEQITALDGADWITPGGGNDTIDGGAGNDMVSFFDLEDTRYRTSVQFRLDIDLTAGTARNHTGSEVLQIFNVERITGTIFADRIKGDAGDNHLRGLGDADWFIATTGNDTLDGGTSRDMVSYVDWTSTDANVAHDFFSDEGAPPPSRDATGVVIDLTNTANNTNLAAGHSYSGIERMTGSGRQDVFYGDASENDFRGLGDFDWFVGSSGGRERYFGGDGVDTLTYFMSTEGVIANLRNGALVNGEETGYGTGGDAARDLYFEIENLIGTQFDDHLTGNGGRNMLSGLDGDDFIFGYGGIDQLKGGLGNDTLNGGGSSDYAIYEGDAADYTLTRTDWNRVTVSGAEGTDSLIDIEYFRFGDGDLRIWDMEII